MSVCPRVFLRPASSNMASRLPILGWVHWAASMSTTLPCLVLFRAWCMLPLAGLSKPWRGPALLEKGTADVTNVGVVFDTKSRKLQRTRKRSWRPYLGLKHLLRLKKVTSECLRVCAGHIVHYFSIQRAGMSCLRHTYKFIYRWLDGKSHIIPGAVKRELRIVVGLVFQVEVDLGAPYSPAAFCGDSSSYGCCFQGPLSQNWNNAIFFVFTNDGGSLRLSRASGLVLGCTTALVTLGQVSLVCISPSHQQMHSLTGRK